MTTYLYVHVDADSEDDAIDIAKNIDGGDFIPLNQVEILYIQTK